MKKKEQISSNQIHKTTKSENENKGECKNLVKSLKVKVALVIEVWKILLKN